MRCWECLLKLYKCSLQNNKMAMGNSRVPITIIICYRIKFHFLIRWPRNKLTGVVHFFFRCSHNYAIFLSHSLAQYHIVVVHLRHETALWISPQRSSSVCCSYSRWLCSFFSLDCFLNAAIRLSHFSSINTIYRIGTWCSGCCAKKSSRARVRDAFNRPLQR